jgi:PAS domain-containing protein
LDVRAHVSGRDEIAQLGESLNRLAAETQARETRLRKSEARLRTIITAEPECVKVVDARGGLLEMNPAGLAMLEAGSLAEVQARPLIEWIAPEHRAAFVGVHRGVFAGENRQLEFEIIGAHGTRR